jgi:hypothetical protein
MTHSYNRPRWVASIALAAVGAMTIAGCDVKKELLEPQNPGLIDPSAVASPAAAYALKVGAIGKVRVVVDPAGSNGNCNSNAECLWEEVGNLTDELHNSDFQNTRQDIDQRSISDDNPSIPYTPLTQARGYVRDAIAAVKTYIPDSTTDLAELYNGLAFLELSLAENFCNGIPLGSTVSGVITYGQPLSNMQVLDSALVHVDSALTVNTGSTDAASQSQFIRRASQIIKTRILIDQAKFPQAAGLTAGIPSTYAYMLATSQAKNESFGLWQIVNSTARLSVSDSAEIINGASTPTKNALPFASANDPRVPVQSGPDAGVAPEDATTPMFVQKIWGRFDPTPMVSGIDARLMEAELALKSNDIPGMMTILNALRAAPPKISNYQPAVMAPLAIPASIEAATTLYFREKAFWTFGRGQRLNDMRRQMRQYGRSEDAVFPTGSYFKGGEYGHTINFPVTSAEKANPNFTGCTDRNP